MASIHEKQNLINNLEGILSKSRKKQENKLSFKWANLTKGLPKNSHQAAGHFVQYILLS